MERRDFLKTLLGGGIALAAGGCAAPVPGTGAVGGKSLTVTMRFAGPMNPAFYYFFLINRYGATGSLTARGPVAVYAPGQGGLVGYGNGFATGSPGSLGNPPDYGLTDYVLYNQHQPGSIGVYHFPGDPNIPNSAVYQGMPAQYTLPDLTNIADIGGASTLSFQLQLSQLITDTSDPNQKAREAAAIRYIQVNIVATNYVPTDQNSSGVKEVDAMGNTLDPAQESSFLTIDLSQNRTYTSQDTTTLLSPEPAGDVYPAGTKNDAIDIIYWSITVSS
jgi:hypothetical protein